MPSEHGKSERSPRGDRFPLGKLGIPLLWTVPIWSVACGLSWYVSSSIPVLPESTESA